MGLRSPGGRCWAPGPTRRSWQGARGEQWVSRATHTAHAPLELGPEFFTPPARLSDVPRQRQRDKGWSPPAQSPARLCPCPSDAVRGSAGRQRRGLWSGQGAGSGECRERTAQNAAPNVTASTRAACPNR
ncbi:hypothetical protein KIL84_006137 [Mauremys mutica]|uniref:Uncharacterized protein n=1 Tax=Mauremys mutica TaxID=74926 RepID=A0A9D4AXG7_9SAUR|nr:hypothetical protein KIL84_006137 [Mauremys mutica]